MPPLLADVDSSTDAVTRHPNANAKKPKTAAAVVVTFAALFFFLLLLDDRDSDSDDDNFLLLLRPLLLLLDGSCRFIIYCYAVGLVQLLLDDTVSYIDVIKVKQASERVT